MGSRSDADHGIAQMALGLPQRLSGRVFAGETSEQARKGTGAAQALQIAHQGQGAIPNPAPPQAHRALQLDLHEHGALLVAESPQQGIALGNQPHRSEAGFQEIGIPEHRGQDGEMGHGHHDRVG